MKYDSNHICTPGQEVEVGKQYQYYEDGYVADATVIADESNEEMIGFKIRIDNPLSEAWHGGNLPAGHEFSCSTTREPMAYSGMWRIYPLGEYVVVAKRP